MTSPSFELGAEEAKRTAKVVRHVERQPPRVTRRPAESPPIGNGGKGFAAILKEPITALGVDTPACTLKSTQFCFEIILYGSVSTVSDWFKLENAAQVKTAEIPVDASVDDIATALTQIGITLLQLVAIYRFPGRWIVHTDGTPVIPTYSTESLVEGTCRRFDYTPASDVMVKALDFQDTGTGQTSGGNAGWVNGMKLVGNQFASQCRTFTGVTIDYSNGDGKGGLGGPVSSGPGGPAPT